jgi:hypothetical protein
MNARIERAMNFENLGTRIMENKALDQKIWLWKLSGAKRSFQEVPGGICGFFVNFCNYFSKLKGLAITFPHA